MKYKERKKKEDTQIKGRFRRGAEGRRRWKRVTPQWKPHSLDTQTDGQKHKRDS